MAISSASVSAAPSLSLTMGVGTRVINWAAGSISASCRKASPRYGKARLFNSTTNAPLTYSSTVTTYRAGTATMSISAGSVSVPMTASSTTYVLLFQWGETSSSGGTPTNWHTAGSYSIVVTGTRKFLITYYDYEGGGFYSTTGDEASYHTVYTPPESILPRFDHWNTKADDSGVSFLPDSRRYVNGNLDFYAFQKVIDVKARNKLSSGWVQNSIRIKKNGEIVTPTEAYVKIDGLWRPIS